MWRPGIGILKQNGGEIRDRKYARNTGCPNNPRDPVFSLFESRLQNFKAKWRWDSGLKVGTQCGISNIITGITGLSENLGRDNGIKEPHWWPCLMELRLAFCLSFRMRHANEKRLRAKKFMSDKKRDRKQQWEHLLTKAQGECHRAKKTATNPFSRYWTARHWYSCVRRLGGDALNDSLFRWGRKKFTNNCLKSTCVPSAFLLSNNKKP